MRFGWINAVNAFAAAFLIAVNLIAVRLGIAGDFKSRRVVVNVLEQIGRCGSMALMVLPLTSGWEFGFSSDRRMVAWLGSTILLLAVYALLWVFKRGEKPAVLYGLAIVPAVLFLTNGLLLQHPLLTVFALLFGAAHLLVVRENVRGETTKED